MTNWIAPFHHCPRCRESLNWREGCDVFDVPLLTGRCEACRLWVNIYRDSARSSSVAGPSDADESTRPDEMAAQRVIAAAQQAGVDEDDIQRVASMIVCSMQESSETLYGQERNHG